MSTTAKFIRSDDQTHEALQQLAKEHKLSNTKLLAAMVEYFRVTKADPQQPAAPDLTSSLAKLTAKLADLDKRTIGFIREQEKTYLKPMLAQVQALQQLSTPAVSAPAGLTEPQLAEMERWLTAVIRKGFRPEFRHPNLLSADAPTYTAPPELAPLRKLVTSVLGRELSPTQFVPRAPAPAPPTATPPPPATPSQSA